MKPENKIPLVIGVTGHIDLREEDGDALLAAVCLEMEKLRNRFPCTPLKMISGLAAGADLLCADAAEKLNIPLTAVLPFPAEEYRQDFSAADWTRVTHHLARAETVYTVTPAEAEPESADRDFFCRQVEIHIAEHCHILIALWDGQEDNALGCGNSGTLRFALNGEWIPLRGMALRSGENSAVIHIMTPGSPDHSSQAGAVRYLGSWQMMEDVLKSTEEFNRLAEKAELEENSLLSSLKESQLPHLPTLDALYRTADTLSLRFARQYRRTLKSLAALATLLTFAFLLYDNGEMIPMILLCGAALGCSFLCCRQAARTVCHKRYLEFRTLAEALRVQFFLRCAGSGIEVQRCMTWSQQRETGWVLLAVSAVNAGNWSVAPRDISVCWVRGQETYHHLAEKKASDRVARNERILDIAGKCSILLYAAVLCYELLCGGLIFSPSFSLRDPESIRTLLKIVLGTISAGTLFIAEYYGKLNLRRERDDHRKMESFFRKVSSQMSFRGQDENLLEILAREELSENGNWCSYRRDNAPELNL